MTGRRAVDAGRRNLPRFGKVHLTLADWRLGALRYQQPRDAAGALPATIECGFERDAGSRRSVVLERGAASEFPTSGDDDVILGLIHLASRADFPEIVRFVPADLLRIIRWPLTAKSYARLRRALARYVKLTATFSESWYDRPSRGVARTLVTGIVAQAEVVTARGRGAAGAIPASHVQWTEHFQRSLQEGSLVDVDFELLFSWRRPGCKELFRHLNKTWHGGRRPRPYERDLKDLACGHLGMKDAKDLKRNFQALVVEMEQAAYLVACPPADRYVKLGVGRWRVRLELHPSRVRGATMTNDGDAPAREIAEAYRHARFGPAAARPARHEIDQVAKLLAIHSPEALRATLAEVAAAVKSRQAGDKYLGFAVPYIEEALATMQAAAVVRDRSAAAQEDVDREIKRLQEEKALREARQAELFAVWETLPHPERKALIDAALNRAGSAVVRRRIAASSLELPCAEALAELARSRAPGAGECALGVAFSA